MEKRIHTVRNLLYIFATAYVLLLLFSPLGTLKIDFGDIIRSFPPMGNTYVQEDLGYGIVGNIVMVVFLLTELAMLHIPKKACTVIGILLCIFRMVHPLFFAVIDLGSDSIISVQATVFFYLLLFSCVASLVCHIVHSKLLAVQKTEEIS